MKKFNLNDLKVKSFVASFERNEENTIKGGINTIQLSCNHCKTEMSCPSAYSCTACTTDFPETLKNGCEPLPE